MPLLRINSGPMHPALADGDALETGLPQAVGALPPGAPIVVLLHGLRFSPFLPGHDPHGHIYALDPNPVCPKAVSWPRGLGFGHGPGVQGLCIPFAWDGAVRLGEGYRRAGQAGRQLAHLLDLIHRHRPAGAPYPIRILGHSLGARVALRALATTQAPIDRIVLLNPAEFAAPATQALASRSGQSAQILHVAAAENRVFDTAFQCAAPRRHMPDIAIGLRPPRAPNWHMLHISDAAHRARLADLGLTIAPRTKRVCHWSTYLRPGMFALFRALLTDPQPLALDDLIVPAPPCRMASPLPNGPNIRAAGIPIPTRVPPPVVITAH